VIVCLSPGGASSSSATGPAESVLVATVEGVYALERTGTNQGWRIGEHRLRGAHVSALLFVRERNLIFAGAHSGGLFASEDEGETWTRSMHGIAGEHEHIFSLTAQPRGEQIVLWAGTQPAALYRSDDLGRTWHEVPSLRSVSDLTQWTFPAPPHQAHVKHVAFHPRDPKTLYVCVEQGALLKSVDDGATWRELTGYVSPDDLWYRDAHRIAIARTDPAKLYLASGEGLYTSGDAGETWTHLTTRHDRIGYPDALFIDPRDDRTLYIAGGGTSPDQWRKTGEGNTGIMRSIDGGTSWEELHNGLPAHVRGNIEAMSLHRWVRTVGFYAGTAVGDVFVSEDRGREWELAASGLPPISKVGHYKAFLAG
jgi:photosystem II stability/assembly factor-like uncharacterized protein